MKRLKRLVRRARLESRTRLERKTWMPRFRKKPRREPRVRNRKYMDWVCTLRCLLADHPGHRCRGRVDPHHAGVKPGARLKCHDIETVPLCRGAHDDFEDHRGLFKGWSREQRREWQDWAIAITQKRARESGWVFLGDGRAEVAA